MIAEEVSGSVVEPSEKKSWEKESVDDGMNLPFPFSPFFMHIFLF